MNYCKVVNGEIIEGPRAIPGKTRQEILNDGWLPHRLVKNLTTSTVFLSASWEVTPTEVIETQVVRPKTQEELLEDEGRKEKEKEKNRNASLEQEVAKLSNIAAELRVLIDSLKK